MFESFGSEEQGHFGSGSVLFASFFSGESGYAVASAASAVRHGDSNGKSDRVLHTGEIPKDGTVDSAGSTREDH